MFARAQFLAFLVIGGLAGVAYGLVVLAPTNHPPPTPPNVETLGKTLPAPPPLAATPVVVAAPVPAGEDEADAGGEPEPAQAANAADRPDGGLLVPSTVHESAVFDDDITLIPRGPGRFAVLDLRPIGQRVLTIRAGQMQRDGGGVGDIKSRRRVGIVRGPKVRVELLHLGFDREGRPTVAHVRTTGSPPIEGVISLRRGERTVRVLPDRSDATSDEPF